MRAVGIALGIAVIICGIAAASVAFSGDSGQLTASIEGQSTYIESITFDDGDLGKELHVELNASTPRTVHYVLLLENGEQIEYGELDTGETRTTIHYNLNQADSYELVVVHGGHVQSTIGTDHIEGGTILERTELDVHEPINL